MYLRRHASALAAVFLLSMSPARALAAPDASGHWEGAIHAPFGEVVIEVDLAPNADGKLSGTFSNPGEQLKGLPFWNVQAEGPSLVLEIKAGSGGGTLKGKVSADGRSISGDFLQSVYAVPFSLTRTGDAHIEPAPRSAAIDTVLEGTWLGTLGVDGSVMELALTMTNHADGTSTSSWGTNPGVQIPIIITYQDSTLTLTSHVDRGGFSGTVNADHNEITGTFTEKQFAAPVTFHRAGADGKR